jgi:plasmid stability protein
MTTITIRNVPEETHAELAARAARAGQSLQEYLRATLVEVAQRPDKQAWLAAVRARVLATHSSLSTDKILAYRDADRR